MSNIYIPSPKADNDEDEYTLVTARHQLALYQHSVNNKWNLSSDVRRGIAGFAMGIVADENQGVRARINASKLLLSIDNLQSTEQKNVAELTLRWELAEMSSGGTEGLAHLQPPAEGESWVDDTPVASVAQGGDPDAD